MRRLENLSALHALYERPAPTAIRKVADKLTPAYEKWIMASKFCIVATVGPEGTDASPRGDAGPVVRKLDEATLALPDWRGNQRLDTLENIVRDPRISLLFMVEKSTNVVRVNGRAFITDDEDLRQEFAHAGKRPTTVAVISIGEIYFQCARSLIRSGLWNETDRAEKLPTPGEILSLMSDGEVGGHAYDAQWPERAAKTMW